jgi:hypothetical protein
MTPPAKRECLCKELPALRELNLCRCPKGGDADMMSEDDWRAGVVKLLVRVAAWCGVEYPLIDALQNAMMAVDLEGGMSDVGARINQQIVCPDCGYNHRTQSREDVHAMREHFERMYKMNHVLPLPASKPASN